LEDQLRKKGDKTAKLESNQDLLDRIEILKDENDALRISIQAALDAKQEDLKMYQLLLDNARKNIEHD
jgi:hypothetical protein